MAVKQSVYGARAFYICMYLGFYYTAYLYPNSLSLDLKNHDYFWFVLYFIVQGVSVYYFLTTHKNPGYLKPDTTFGQYDALMNKSGETEEG